jgi:hypothetical protein
MTINVPRLMRGVTAPVLVATAALLACTPRAQARVTKIITDDVQPLTSVGQTIP